MKKFFIALLITVFFSQNSYSRPEWEPSFNLWLAENGFKQYLQEVDLCKKKKITYEIKEVCRNYPGGRWAFESNLKIKFYDRAELPEKTTNNDDTLTYYLWIYLNKNWARHKQYSDIKASKNPYKFNFDLREEDPYLKEQMQKTALLSYLLYENGKIVIDEITPKEKFLGMFKNDTKYHSQSNGKSIAAYIMGHAICKQYIDNVDVQLNDWPVLKDTLYYDAKLIDLLNMNAGDQLYVKSNTFLKKKNVSPAYPPIKTTMYTILNGSKKSKNQFNYNSLPPHVVLNYLIFKIGDEKFEQLLNEIFTNKVRMEHNSSFALHESATYQDKSITNTMLATRYDYLRIAKAMLDDWKNDTCEGKFLKDIYDRRIKKTTQYVSDRKSHPSLYGTTEYAGFFHTGYVGIKDKPVLGMDGYGGQSILIDFENERIVSVMAIHQNYNWKKIVFEKIKEGFN